MTPGMQSAVYVYAVNCVLPEVEGVTIALVSFAFGNNCTNEAKTTQGM